MSSLTYKYRAKMENVFNMEAGYVLNFSNSTFRKFFMEKAEIDIYEDAAYAIEPSKAKKLRLFVEKENDSVVGKVIIDLLEMRDAIIERNKEYDDEFVDQYADCAEELREEAKKMANGAILFANNEERLNADIAMANIVLRDIISIGGKVCVNSTYTEDSSENSINDYFRDMFSGLYYSEVKDQTRHGISSSGKDAGEVDILLSKDGKEVAIIEALKLNSVDTNYIKEHIEKAIINYNALGTSTFIIVYASPCNFEDFWNRFVDHVQKYPYPLSVRKAAEKKPYTNAAIRIAEMILSRDGYDFPVYYVALNMKTR